MKTMNLTAHAAHKYVLEKRSEICPNPGFMEMLRQFENELWVSNQIESIH